MELSSVYIFIVILIIFLLYCYYVFLRAYEKEKKHIFSTIDENPEIRMIQDNWEIIRDEMPKFDLNELDKSLTRDIGVWDTDKNLDLLDKVNSNPKWVTGWSKGWYHFPIIYTNKPINGIDKILPNTYNILKQIPSIYVAGYSILLPNTVLDWHVDETGRETDSLALNLGLVSDNSELTVKGKKYIHTEFQSNGKAIIFDSNYKHKVENKSDNIRVILYIDFKINNAIGKIVKGYGLASKLGYPTINLKLNKKLDCGVYTGQVGNNMCIVFVDNSKVFAEVHMIEFDPTIVQNSSIYLSDLKKINPKHRNGIIGNFCSGCV